MALYRLNLSSESPRKSVAVYVPITRPRDGHKAQMMSVRFSRDTDRQKWELEDFQVKHLQWALGVKVIGNARKHEMLTHRLANAERQILDIEGKEGEFYETMRGGLADASKRLKEQIAECAPIALGSVASIVPVQVEAPVVVPPPPPTPTPTPPQPEQVAVQPPADELFPTE